MAVIVEEKNDGDDSDASDALTSSKNNKKRIKRKKKRRAEGAERHMCTMPFTFFFQLVEDDPRKRIMK